MNRQERKNRTRYFRSGIFKRFFLSYALIILAVFGLFIGWSLISYQREAEELKNRDWEQKAASFGNWMDQHLMQAQNICASVNVSESARSVLQTAYVEKKTISAMQLYNLLGELTRIKGSTRTASIYSLILAFQGDSKAYIPGSVISVNGSCRIMETFPFFGISTAARVLGVTGTQILLNKEYLIYGDGYTGFGSQSSTKGQVLVLIEQDSLLSALQERTGRQTGLLIRRRGQPAFSSGEETGHVFTAASMADGTVDYVLFAPDNEFRISLPITAMLPMIIMAMASIAFLLLTYLITRRNYRPIEHIQRMVDSPSQAQPDSRQNEFEHIIQGISGLIGERNGYRERMVTITPYARQGMLQAVIHGSGRPETLVEEQFSELKRNYYMVGLINTAIIRETPAAERRYRDLQELILSQCRDLSGEDIQVVAVPENLQNTFVIVTSDERDVFENFYFELYRKLEETAGDESTLLTIGTGHRESSLDRLGEACRDAEKSLGQMLTGGRGAVYFPEERDQDRQGYYFPRDAQKQIVKALKERNLDALNQFLDDVYQRNMIETDLPADEVRQLTDELYWTIQKALRHAFDMSTTHVRMEPIRDAATVDEIFSYYRQVFAASLQEIPAQEESEKESSLEDDLCRYIEDHLYDEDLSLNGVADRFGVSTKMVGLICKKRYGQTFLTYVRDRQIRRAAGLLKETGLSLEEISTQCGFSNILTFRRNFKSIMGVNPSEYRE